MDSQTKGLMFSSKKDDWATPQDLVDFLRKRFYFDLDPCANGDNAKALHFIDQYIDGLKQSWRDSVCQHKRILDDGYHQTITNGLKFKSAFVNPPYGRRGVLVPIWLKKCWEEAQKGMSVVVLTASRTDTKWFYNYVMHASEVYFIKGRLHFSNEPSPAPFPSVISVFLPFCETDGKPTIFGSIYRDKNGRWKWGKEHSIISPEKRSEPIVSDAKEIIGAG